MTRARTSASAWVTPGSGAPSAGHRTDDEHGQEARSTGLAPRPRLLSAERTEHGALLGTADAEQLPAHSAAGDASRELSEVTRRAARVATPDDQRRLVTVGSCPEPGCAGRLQSLIRPDAAGAAPAVRCRADPAHHWAGEELMLLRRRLAAKAGTAQPPGAARPASPRPSSPGTAHPAAPDGATPPASRAQGSSAPSGGGEADTVRIVWLSASDITRLWGTPSGSVYRLASQRAWRRRSRDGPTYCHEADVVRALSERHPRPVA
ncbi:hypothetical protein [Streptomyces sp. NPDC004728]|uniref:hypothetical protein n=1 Tax=Streptomyces sp. NPDC004728 TaxID=3154289 RepID=UPI0033B96037